MVQFYSPKPAAKNKSKIEVTIIELDQFGQGVAKYQGRTVFVSGALLGEQVVATMTESKRHFDRANVLALLRRSPQRESPRCVHYGQCGGCQQQHISRSLQQQSKANALSRLMQQACQKPVQISDVISADDWHYRRLARLSLYCDSGKRQLLMGFRRHNSKKIIAITQCPVLGSVLERLIVPLSLLLGQLAIAPYLGRVELVASDNGAMLVLRHLRALSQHDRQRLLQFCVHYQLGLFLDGGDELHGLEHINGPQPEYQINNLRLNFNPQDFIQVNAQINQQMINRVQQWLDLQAGDRLLDRFCGMGNFTLALSVGVQQVTGIEGVPSLVDKAIANAQPNQLSHVRFWQHDLQQTLSGQPFAIAGFNKVLLDPARSGAAQVMAHIITLQPERIVYVSCDPATLARDCSILLSAGYGLAKLAMLDMFPDTSHLECIGLFTKSGLP